MVDNLNNKIGKLLDMPHTTDYLVMHADGYAHITPFATRSQAENWLTENPTDGASIEARNIYPNYSQDLGAAKMIIDRMGEFGFWVAITSPKWEETRYNWYASFDYHGTTDSRPLWQAGHTNPAMAIVLAAISCIEGNPELFKELSF